MTNSSKKVEASTKKPVQAELGAEQKTKGDYTGYFYRSIQDLNTAVSELYAEIILLKKNNGGGK